MKTKWHVVFLVFVFIILTFLVSCGAGPYAIKNGELRDVIFSVEPRENNTFSVWMVHDDVGVYCTYDQTIIDKIKEIFYDETQAPEVYLTYRSINNNDPESGNWTLTGGCAAEGSRTTRYKIIDVCRVGNECFHPD